MIVNVSQNEEINISNMSQNVELNENNELRNQLNEKHQIIQGERINHPTEGANHPKSTIRIKRKSRD